MIDRQMRFVKLSGKAREIVRQKLETAKSQESPRVKREKKRKTSKVRKEDDLAFYPSEIQMEHESFLASRKSAVAKSAG